MNFYNDECTYNSIIENIKEDNFEKIGTNKELRENSFCQTIEQQKRDKQITLLLSLFVENYRKRVDSNGLYKVILFSFSLLFIIVLSIVMFKSIAIISYRTASVDKILSFISACATLIAAPIGILKIMVKYIFPPKEEENITKIVKAVQKSDLENRKVNINVSKTDND